MLTNLSTKTANKNTIKQIRSVNASKTSGEFKRDCGESKAVRVRHLTNKFITIGGIEIF